MNLLESLRGWFSVVPEFVFYYPLFMSWLWMTGTVIFYLRHERGSAPGSIPALPADAAWPPVSVLIPCFNEGDNVRETVGQALRLDYPEFEVIAINDGSADNTGALLDELAAAHSRLRVVHLARNQGKAMALQAGSLLARHDILIGIDGDALLDPRAAWWMARHFVADASVGAVTGNPRIRNRTTLLGRVQVGEFSSIVGMIKRAQRSFGRIFSVSGVITAFRRGAVEQVGSWSPDMLTEDIDITWKLQRAGWDVRFEPHALVWILMPETLRGLWRQRLRWAMGGVQVLLRNLDVLVRWRHKHLWPLMLELFVSVIWSYALLLVVVAGLCQWLLSWWLAPELAHMPLLPAWSTAILGVTCLFQFALSKWMDSRYDHGLGKNYYWMIWYPLVFWVISCAATIVACPRVIARGGGERARWVSPDRGIRIDEE